MCVAVDALLLPSFYYLAMVGTHQGVAADGHAVMPNNIVSFS
jgi:hypothetical protein